MVNEAELPQSLDSTPTMPKQAPIPLCPATAAARFHQQAVRCTRRLLDDDQAVRADAIFMLNEFAQRLFRQAVVRLLVIRWLDAVAAERDGLTSVLCSFRRDAVDYLHRKLTRRELPVEAAALIELLAAICPPSRYEAGLMWELRGHPQADESVRKAARVAYERLNSVAIADG